ncbi:hypothetical protein Sam46_gp66 [Bacillus phage vB_BcM_Sam46]|uniref:Uncharacterized protein n=2 Tax=Caudoviricetes TaxID=2731619 RepID=A0A6G9L741_9CAUD|nr:hypothetical protein Sam112_gp63 [Bacillus phage vB_BcM_Sam112]QIQ61267.1 hypothetical protein Sam46_gp66 [Bacillus phage vB_BcM_Sam46]
MIHYPNGFDPVETNGVYANDNGYDIIRPRNKPDSIVICEGPAKVVYHPPVADIEKLTAAARSKEIIVNVPKLKPNEKEIEEMTHETSTAAAIEEMAKREAAMQQAAMITEMMSKLSERDLETIKDMSSDELVKRFEEKKENKKRHLLHPFYQRANEYREEERRNQIVKGSEKYPTPFEPMEWTPKQLLQHAMQENVDQAHYIYGLYEWIEEMENEISSLKQQRDWEKNKADKLEKQVGSFQAYKESHGEMLAAIGRLTRYLITEFPEAGKGTDWSIDVAIELLKDYKFYMDGMVPKSHYDELNAKYAEFEKYHETVRNAHNEMLTELNSLAKYMIVHYPGMLEEGEKATYAARRIMDAYRQGSEFNAKG